MKKLSAMLVAFILVAATAFTAFAAGINDSEQAVLNELKTSVKMNGSEMVIPSEFVNQAENYFNTIDMTADESSQIVAILKKGESFLENSGASNIADLTFAQKQTLLSYGKEVVGVLGMTMSYDTSSKKQFTAKTARLHSQLFLHLQRQAAFRITVLSRQQAQRLTSAALSLFLLLHL